MRDDDRMDMRLHVIDRFMEENGFARLFARFRLAVLYADEFFRFQMIAVFAIGRDDKIVSLQSMGECALGAREQSLFIRAFHQTAHVAAQLFFFRRAGIADERIHLQRAFVAHGFVILIGKQDRFTDSTCLNLKACTEVEGFEPTKRLK